MKKNGCSFLCFMFQLNPDVSNRAGYPISDESGVSKSVDPEDQPPAASMGRVHGGWLG